MVEVVTVLVLISIIGALALWSFGNSTQREVNSKVYLDLSRLNAAKTAWRTDHPRDAFPLDEATRFLVLSGYVKVGLQSVPNLAAMEPNANLVGAITYTINGEGVLPVANNAKSGQVFNLSTSQWQ